MKFLKNLEAPCQALTEAMPEVRPRARARARVSVRAPHPYPYP